MAPTTPRLIIHGGAGHITRSNLPPTSWAAYRTFLSHLTHSTYAALLAGRSALDAATTAVVALEENPLFNCGRGAVFTRSGTIELEASIMVSRGYRKRGVGVTLVRRVRNPIKLAREMLVRGEMDGGGGGNGGGGDPSGGSGGAQGHVFLSGEVVEHLAEGWGLEMCEEGWHWTRKRWEEHKRGLENEAEGKGGLEGEDWGSVGYMKCEGGWDGKEYLPQGTVGCVCLDREGVLCVATSTGGLTNKLPGRVGDTPTLGAGFWAEEWETSVPALVPQPRGITRSEAVATLLPDSLKRLLNACFPSLLDYTALPTATSTLSDYKHPQPVTCAAAMSGTGNGDSFLRLDAVRTVAAIMRFAPNRTLASAVKQIAGSGGELERSAGDRWETGEGQGGIIGISVVDGKGEVVFDFNCGGMFRAWVDDEGTERVMVFKDEY